MTLPFSGTMLGRMSTRTTARTSSGARSHFARDALDDRRLVEGQPGLRRVLMEERELVVVDHWRLRVGPNEAANTSGLGSLCRLIRASDAESLELPCQAPAAV